MELSLNGWLKLLPPELTAQTIDMDPQKAADLAKQDVPVIPA